MSLTIVTHAHYQPARWGEGGIAYAQWLVSEASQCGDCRMPYPSAPRVLACLVCGCPRPLVLYEQTFPVLNLDLREQDCLETPIYVLWAVWQVLTEPHQITCPQCPFRWAGGLNQHDLRRMPSTPCPGCGQVGVRVTKGGNRA
jgi:Zn finger protein HypA/HybF involved in hydrogenase expression